jgi:CRISPR-associated endonuclease/helicase Cas3
MQSFADWFNASLTEGERATWKPHPWQLQLAANQDCESRLIRIPTGLGKTLGVLAAWAYHRLHRNDASWPRRLVWCLPMRTLVDQTANEADAFVRKIGMEKTVGVFRLMGGVDEARWYADPERSAILIGTQDMLLSRALNRGYAMGRAAWPRAFGMIHADALWVMDEVQLMGVGLTTSAQIQTFWNSDRDRWGNFAPLPRSTWWMSATLQPDWLRSPETTAYLPDWRKKGISINEDDRKGTTWETQKKLTIAETPVGDCGTRIVDLHREHVPDPHCGRQTLVVVNTVKKARELYASVEKSLKGSGSKAELRLIHSRFRPYDRKGWVGDFLSRKTLNPGVDRIVIATQVVEAGVDISASCLFSELAPWPSLVQRFGRAARYGGEATVVVIDPAAADEKQAAPYAIEELNAARTALRKLTGASILDLENFEATIAKGEPDFLQELYPFEPLHVLLRHEFEELFDTAPDLSGADLDVSRFIREGEDQRDLQVFWRHWDGYRPPDDVAPFSDELCSVGILDAKGWVAKAAKDTRGSVWAWNYVDGVWAECRADTLRPGMILLISAEVGGYDPQLGFTGEKPKKGAVSLDLSRVIGSGITTPADYQESSDIPSQAIWKTIGTHGKEAGKIGAEIARTLSLSDSWQRLIDLSLRLHDWGKAHPAFALGTYRVHPSRADLAKAPPEAWPAKSLLYNPDRLASQTGKKYGKRSGFRHELASALALLELLNRFFPEHPAFKQPAGLWLEQSEDDSSRSEESAISEGLVETSNGNGIANELNGLTGDEFDLALFLIASHHGKVRVNLQASPLDQRFPYENRNYVGLGMPIRGVRDGDPVFAISLNDRDGNDVLMPDLQLSLAPASIGLSKRYGASWSERMLRLVSKHGPFLLAYLEGLIRTADARASILETVDPSLVYAKLEIPKDAVEAIEGIEETDIPTEVELVEEVSDV